MPDHLKISVITVCLNAQESIERTIQSVLSQSYKNIEYIIVDGLSSDRTFEIIHKYKDGISKIVSEKDSGIYDAMNKGVRLATGDIIYFLNADDQFHDERVIEDIASTFEADPQLDILCGRVVPVHSIQRARVWGHELSFIGSFKNRRDYLKNCVCHQRLFCRSHLFKKIGEFNTHYKICGDVEWLMRILSQEIHIKETSRNIAFYNCAGASIQNIGLHNKEKLQIVLRHVPFLEATDYLSFALFRNIFKKRAQTNERY